jgi:hypothetical protein
MMTRRIQTGKEVSAGRAASDGVDRRRLAPANTPPTFILLICRKVAVKRQKGQTRFPFLVGALALCGLASWQGLVATRAIGDRKWTLAFGFMCTLLLLATVQGIAVPLIRRLESRAGTTAVDNARNRLDHGDYIAKFSIQDRLGVTLLVGAFILITAFLCIHPVPLYMRGASGGMLAVLLWIAYRFSFTTVRFANKRIIFRLFPFDAYSESYTDITSLRAQPGNLRIGFADGRRLNLWTGLGDAALIVAILKNRVEVLPKVAGWQG